MLLRPALYSVAAPLLRGVWRVTRGVTLGVRGLVQDQEGQVLLVEHTYMPGWYMPGGGVERGETAERALERELVEEAGVEVLERPRLLSVHEHGRRHPGDHVLFYRVGAWKAVAATSRGEIARTGFFSPKALPEGTTQGTRRRILEALDGAPPDPAW
jgi:ADP-ribose pyrophosphatase YjhB (NUDIX family)